MDAEDVVARTPRDADELHAWIREYLGLEVPCEAIVAGHQSPFDYLVHAFFEGGGVLGGDRDGPGDCVVWANRGGGKTFLGAVATLLDLVFKPGVEVRILGGSLEQSKRMHAHLRGLLGRPPFSAMVDGRITERRVRLKNGSSVELLAQSQVSVRGTRVQKLRCDEVELFDPEVWEAAQLVTRSARVEAPGFGGLVVRGSVECLSTMHRPYGLMFSLVKEAAEGRRRLFKWGVVDVLDACGEEYVCAEGCETPCLLWPECRGRAKERDAAGQAPGHITIDDAIDLKSRVGAATWESEMLCLRPSRSDTVLPEFDPARHIVAAAPAGGGLWIGGMDFGYRAPTVVLWALVDPLGVVTVVGEHAAAGLVLDEHVAAIADAPYPRPAWIGIDPAGRQRNDQTGLSAEAVLRAAGLVPRVRSMSIAEGLTLVRQRLKPASGGPPTLFVHEGCVKLAESLERYHYPPDDAESMTPVKDGFDHAVDALRYMIGNLDRPHVTKRSGYL